MENKIKFIESHIFIGEHMTVEVNGVSHGLEFNKNKSYEQQAVELLKEKYNIKFELDEVKFEWDGTL